MWSETFDHFLLFVPRCLLAIIPELLENDEVVAQRRSQDILKEFSLQDPVYPFSDDPCCLENVKIQ